MSGSALALNPTCVGSVVPSLGGLDALGSLGGVCVCMCVHVQQLGPLCQVRPHCGAALPGTLQKTGGVTLGWGHVPCHGTQPPACPWSPPPTHPANFWQLQAAPKPVPATAVADGGRGKARCSKKPASISGLSRLGALPRGTHSPSHISTHWRRFRFLFSSPLLSF